MPKIIRFTPSQRLRPDLPDRQGGGLVQFPAQQRPKGGQVTIEIERCVRGDLSRPGSRWVEDKSVFIELPSFSQWTRETVDTLFARALGELPKADRHSAFTAHHPHDFDVVQTIDEARHYLISFYLDEAERCMLKPDTRRYLDGRYGRPDGLSTGHSDIRARSSRKGGA